MDSTTGGAAKQVSRRELRAARIAAATGENPTITAEHVDLSVAATAAISKTDIRARIDAPLPVAGEDLADTRSMSAVELSALDAPRPRTELPADEGEGSPGLTFAAVPVDNQPAKAHAPTGAARRGAKRLTTAKRLTAPASLSMTNTDRPSNREDGPATIVVGARTPRLTGPARRARDAAVCVLALALLGGGGAAVMTTQHRASAERAAIAAQTEGAAIAADEQVASADESERAERNTLTTTRYIREEEEQRADAAADADTAISNADAEIAISKDLVDASYVSAVTVAKEAVVTAQAEGSKPELLAATTALADVTATLHEASYDLAQSWNGRLPDSSLCPVPFDPTYELRCEAVDALVALNEAYTAEFGQTMQLNSGYRTYARQAQLAASTSLAGAAGKSNHGWGLAIDLSSSTIPGFGNAKDTWLQENAPGYGWVRPDWANRGGSKPEYWHWEYVSRTKPKS